MNPTSTITVMLDGRPHDVPEGTTLAVLVAELGHAPGAVGTALNGRFVARALRDDHRLAPGDAVLFFQAIVGG